MKPRRPTGLTLLELAIALAVLAVLGTLAVPSFSARLARERLAATAELLAGDLAEARYQAAQRGQPLHLEPSPGATWCWAVTTVSGCGCERSQACQVRRVLSTEHAQVQILEGQAVHLAPDGTASAQRVATLATPSGDRLGVELLALGRTRICVAAGTSTRYPAC
jgi:type IV fimbrial biogenesis protein FimT